MQPGRGKPARLGAHTNHKGGLDHEQPRGGSPHSEPGFLSKANIGPNQKNKGGNYDFRKRRPRDGAQGVL